MKFRNTLKAGTAAYILALSACGGGSTPADPGIVDYNRVQGIFNARCVGGACHVDTVDPRLFGGDLNLRAEQAGPCTLNVPAQQEPMRMRIIPAADRSVRPATTRAGSRQVESI